VGGQAGTLGCPFKPTLHRIRVDQTCLLELKATATEHSEIRDSLDFEPGSKFREPLRVDLQYDGAAREIASDLCDMRRRHPAGAAPVCPEINEHRNLAFANDLIEFCGIHLYGL
jgi:hypothetical protein